MLACPSRVASCWSLPLLLLAGSAACGPDPRGAGDLGGGGADADPRAGGDGAPAAGCPDVDVLFVIDDSGSMADQQDSLVASFPGFAAGLQQRLASAQSVHVGVVTSEDYAGNPPACRGIGNLITQTSGPASSNRACGPYAGGSSWMDAREPDLAAKFACAAKPGAGGDSDERMARALMNAIDPARSEPGACNAGFMRPQSLLVVVLITDEDDVADGCDGSGTCQSYGSGGTSQEWYDAVVAARGGQPDNIVMLTLIGRSLDNSCGAVPAARLLGFTNRFGNGLIGDVCAPSYDQFFLDALPIIDGACQRWEPVL